ncbi:MAG: class I SAM-dependent methyltransferase, partial [Candidatus Acidiferrum sp.]
MSRRMNAAERLMPSFTKDWVSSHDANWRHWLAKFAGQANIHGLEIGSFEGRSALWFVENILTHPSSQLTCIDSRFRPAFEQNIAPVSARVRVIRGRSEAVLRDSAFSTASFHFIYIDGSHEAPNVLSDAILAFPLLVPGGIIIFDDYRWKSTTPDIPQSMPLIAVDAFVSVFQNELRVLHRGWQVAAEKPAEPAGQRTSRTQAGASSNVNTANRESACALPVKKLHFMGVPQLSAKASSSLSKPLLSLRSVSWKFLGGVAGLATAPRRLYRTHRSGAKAQAPPWDAAYCINLDYRVDRWAAFRQNADAAGITVTRFPAITPDVSPVPAWWSRGGPEHWACLQSHVAVLADALRKNIQRVLVFEDDAIFPPTLVPQAAKAVDALPSGWKGLLLFAT